MSSTHPGCASAWNSPSVSIISPYASDTRCRISLAAALRFIALRPATCCFKRVIYGQPMHALTVLQASRVCPAFELRAEAAK